MADDTAADEAPITFNVKSSSDAKYTITIPLSTTVLDLKNKLSTSEYADIPPDRQRLIYSGRVLKDADTLASYKIKEGNTVHLVKGAASNQRQNPANQGSSAATGGSGATTGAQGVPTNLAAGTGNNPLAGLTGARYAGMAQLPGAGMFGPDGGVCSLFVQPWRQPYADGNNRWVLLQGRSKWPKCSKILNTLRSLTKSSLIPT